MRFILLLLLSGVVLSINKYSYHVGTGSVTETVKMGEEFAISLASNPTTGYRWELVAPSTDLETSSNEKYGDFETSGTGIGAGGKQVFRFNPRKVGLANLRFVHKRPWTDDDAKTVAVNLNIVLP